MLRRVRRVDADVAVGNYVRGWTPPGHCLDAGVGPNDLLLLLRRVVNNLHLLLLILCRWCTGRPRRYNITDVSPLHKYVLPAEVGHSWPGSTDSYGAGGSSRAGNVYDLSVLHFGRFRRGDNPLLGLKLGLLNVLELLQLLLLVLLRCRDNTNRARVRLSSGGVHVPYHYR